MPDLEKIERACRVLHELVDGMESFVNPDGSQD